MKRWMIVVATAACLAACNVSFHAGPQAKPEAGTAEQQAAVAMAAKAFLAQVDAEQYDATWPDASPHLRAMTTQTTWVSTLETMHRMVGTKQARKPVGMGFTHQLDGVPAGDYVAVGFETAFERATLQEKVVMHFDEGRWKVLGYFLTQPFGTAKTGG